jgi:hypothetical protein
MSPFDEVCNVWTQFLYRKATTDIKKKLRLLMGLFAATYQNSSINQNMGAQKNRRTNEMSSQSAIC